MESVIHSKLIPTGFEFGSAKVERIASNERDGYVYLAIETPKQRLTIYATKTGKLRVFDETHAKELT